MAVGVELDPDQAVVEDEAPGHRSRRRPGGAVARGHGRRRQGRDPLLGVGGGVEGQAHSPWPHRAEMARSMSASRRSAPLAKLATASSLTMAIDEPGRMSWNWLSRMSRQISSSSS